jgi:CHAT domain-containing protein/tetratricopeptide (TPR) repeat protein
MRSFARFFFVCAVGLAVIAPHSYSAAAPAALIIPRQVEQESQWPELGRSIERQLAAGERHSYQVSVAGNQFFHFVVNQQGIDVAVTVFGPDGKQIIEVDSPNGRDGLEPVTLVMETSGVYRIEIRSIENNAPAGHYTLKVETQRTATQQDRERIADRATAQQALDRAQSLIVEDTAESLRAAIGQFNEALPISQRLGDRAMESFIHFRLGFVWDRMGDKQQGLAHFFLALPILREIGERRTEGMVLSNIGLSYSSIGEPQKALDYHEQALKLKRELGDKLEQAITLNNLGLTYVSVSEMQKALDCYAQSLALAREIGDRESEAVTLVNLGQAYRDLGDAPRALDYYSQALPVTRAVKDRFAEAVAIHSIGVVYMSLGEQQKALEHFLQALPAFRKLGVRDYETTALVNIGRAYASLGEAEKALEFYNQGLELSRSLDDRQSLTMCLHSLGELYYERLHDPQKALDYFNQSLAVSRAMEGRAYEAETLLGVAKVERDRGNFVDARSAIERALAIVESVRSDVASQRLRTSFFESKQQYYDFYIDLLMRQHQLDPTEQYDVLAFQTRERARARSLAEMLSESGAKITQGVAPALLDRERKLRQRLNTRTEQQIRLLSSKSDDRQVAALRKEIDDLVLQYQEVEDQIRATSPRYAALAQPMPLSLEETRQLLDTDTVLLVYALGEKNSYLWAITTTDLKSYTLPPRREIEASARNVYQLLTARNIRKRFETIDERNKRVAKADADYVQSSLSLSRILLGQIASHLRKKRLLIVGDGVLQYIPFASLPLPAGPKANQSFVPLIAEHEIVNLPSVLSLSVLRRELAGRKPAAKLLAVLADPVFEKTDERVRGVGDDKENNGLSIKTAEPGNRRSRLEDLVTSTREVDDTDGALRIRRLPYTRREAEAISALVPGSQLEKALDFDANRKLATSDELAGYRYIHFATHGLLNNSHPELSGLVLSLIDRSGVEQDGFLRAYEIYDLKLPAELVVLSACRTGLGKEIKGEGIVGLTRGFMYAGAARVLVSLWDVSDEASAELMTQFYRKMLGKERLRPSEALRAAQVQVLSNKRWRAPYYWSAFVLQGEPR